MDTKRWILGLAVALLLAVHPKMGETAGNLGKTVAEFLRTHLHLQAKDVETVKDPRSGLWVVKLRIARGAGTVPAVAYVTSDGRYLILGRLFDLHSGKDVTVQHLPQLPTQQLKTRPPLMEPLLGHGSKVLHLISSPHCTHCRQVFPKVVEFVREHSSVYSLNYIHFGAFTSRRENALIECVRRKAPDLYWEFLQVLYQKGFSSASSWIHKRAQLDCSRAVPVKHRLPGIHAVPTLVLDDGTVLTGTDQILARLGSRPGQVRASKSKKGGGGS